MEYAQLKSNIKQWEGFLARPVVVAAFLTLLCLGLHYSALAGGWRYDDGKHLHFTALYSPWQYFFLPEIMREQSWAHFTPWNALFYEIGLVFSGLAPAGHYAHMLLMLWLTAMATYVLLRLWLHSFSALMGAVLFLAMPATAAVGQMLMTGHYVYGLFFTVLALYFFTRGVREHRIYFSVLAALFYALACWSKELYVPTILALILLPESHWKIRLRHCWPAMAVACAYTIYRLMVLQGVGGYGQSSQTSAVSTTETLSQIGSNLFSAGWTVKLITAYLLISLAILISTRKQRISPVFLLGCLVVIFFPILSVLHNGFGSENLRFLFFASWSLAVLLVWISGTNKFHLLSLILVLLALIVPQQEVVQKIAHKANLMEEQNRFLIESDKENLLLPFRFESLGFLTHISKAITLLEQREPPNIIYDHDEFLRLGENLDHKIFHFNDNCQCVQQMSVEAYQAYVDDFRSRLAAGAEQFLNISFQFTGEGFRKKLSWKFSGPEGNFNLYIREHGLMQLPPSGELTFGITGLLKDGVHVYVHLNAQEGWVARSPRFFIDPGINEQLSWSGVSAANW
jgi:hypothetical protein